MAQSKKRTGVHAHGNGIRIDFRWGSQRYRETVNIPPTEKNLKWAENKRAAVLYDIQCNQFDYYAHFPESRHARAIDQRNKLSSLMWEWLELRRPELAPRTLKRYESMIRTHLEPAFGETDVTEINRADLRHYVAQSALDTRALKNGITPLRGAIDLAIERGVVNTNPAASLRVVRQSDRSKTNDADDPFDAAEREAIIATARATQHPSFLNYIITALWTGMRPGELLALKTECVHLDANVVKVRANRIQGRQGPPKTPGSARDVALVGPARAAIEAQLALDDDFQGHVFGSTLKQSPWYEAESLGGPWQNLLRKADVRYRPLKQTRHTFASMMLTAGEHPMWVATQLGHSDWGMIREIYGQWISHDAAPNGSRAEAMYWQQSQ